MHSTACQRLFRRIKVLTSHLAQWVDWTVLLLHCTSRQRRQDELVQVQPTINEEFAASLVGQDLDVVVDGVNEDGWLFGRTQYDAPGG